MARVFADTFHWIALVDGRDAWHAEAVRLASEHFDIVTCDEVLTEFLAFFADQGPPWRSTAVRLVRAILNDPGVQVLPQTRAVS